MPAATITPVLVADAPTAIGDLYAGPQANTEEALTVRVANKTGADILYRLYVTTSADNAQAAGSYAAYDYRVPANDARDIERGLELPNGYKLQHRASATGLAVRVTGRKRATA